jgi:hypothetical protein
VVYCTMDDKISFFISTLISAVDILPILFIIIVFSCQSRHGCPVLPVRSWLSCPRCPVLAVLSQVPCPGCPVPGALSWLFCPRCPVLAVLSQVPCPVCPVLAVPSRLSCAGGPVQAVVVVPLSCVNCHIAKPFLRVHRRPDKINHIF